MLTLHAELCLVDETLIQLTQLAVILIKFLFSEVGQREIRKTDSYEAWSCEYEERFAAENDHEKPDVKLAPHVEGRSFQVSL